MDVTAAHVGFVIAAYVLSAAVLGGLAIETVLRLKARERELDRLEKSGVLRRKGGR
jgi:heme exporter protein CcmD